MASVYEIWNPQLEVHRAVKLLHPNCNIETRERFQTEIKITAKLHHPNIVEIHGVGNWNGLPYIEMEKADGFTLEQLIHLKGALPVPVTLAIGIMVARALEYAHNHEYVLYNNTYHGIIHRDLKPGNIMVCKDGTVKLMDFGIARPASTSFHTVDGAIIGTLQYLSPEQLESRDLDITTDIYSFGICLYEMICGHYAFPENNITKLLADKTKNRYKSLDSYVLKAPHGLIELIDHCMNYDRSRRPQTSTILQDELNSIYDRVCTQKPEAVVSDFMTQSIREKNIPKKNVVNLRIRKTHVAVILICFALLYSLIIISSNAKKKQAEVMQASKVADSLARKKADSLKLIAQVTHKAQDTQTLSEPVKVVAKTPEQPRVKKPQTSNNLSAPVTEATTGSTMNPVKETKVDQLKTKYDTKDILLIILKELQGKNYTEAASLLSNLDATTMQTQRAQVLKARLLEFTDYKQFTIFILSNTSREAEILIAKARVMLDRNNLESAEQFLESASTSPREIITLEQASNRILYYSALVKSKRFDNYPDENTWKKALEAWYNVKRELRLDPSHDYFKKADEEISRISEKYRAIKG
ncbi:MAG: protein kinase [Fibrobacter sp.]|nr:protein kinase [Fibrobacter sp.]